MKWTIGVIILGRPVESIDYWLRAGANFKTAGTTERWKISIEKYCINHDIPN